ncbi:MAG: glycoside hydrolase family 43 protein [Saprospiraceae bacterium]|nr:glycoside hydrolase family 43 protein [Saprospiraceae bacterium]HPG07689.1 glycoside hydrolase family 43 protein [Saprospiraceae bacterium]HQU54909.1 glycoside hydrolase family 43 protein [Saprospiraceae bacterium]
MNRLHFYAGWALVVIFLTSLFLTCRTTEPSGYFFAYFKGNGEDGLHLAYSPDGFQWKALHGDSSFLTPTAGTDKLMRDPCIILGGDGQYHMVWTVSWNERGIGYASSPDLIHWSPQRYLPVMEHETTARNCWAPELFYDAASDDYLIYWATTIPGRFPETDSLGDSGYNHRMYCTTTKDFVYLTPTRLFYDPGFNVIDATIQYQDNQYVLFFKNETLLPVAEKNLRMATSNHLLGPYTKASAPISGNWVEGPTATHSDSGWIVYFDRYREHQMGAIISSDLIQWTDVSDRLHFPKGARHGTVFPVPSKTILQFINQ